MQHIHPYLLFVCSSGRCLRCPTWPIGRCRRANRGGSPDKEPPWASAAASACRRNFEPHRSDGGSFDSAEAIPQRLRRGHIGMVVGAYPMTSPTAAWPRVTATRATRVKAAAIKTAGLIVAIRYGHSAVVSRRVPRAVLICDPPQRLPADGKWISPAALRIHRRADGTRLTAAQAAQMRHRYCRDLPIQASGAPAASRRRKDQCCERG